jgi:hypothetical protein
MACLVTPCHRLIISLLSQPNPALYLVVHNCPYILRLKGLGHETEWLVLALNKTLYWFLSFYDGPLLCCICHFPCGEGGNIIEKLYLLEFSGKSPFNRLQFQFRIAWEHLWEPQVVLSITLQTFVNRQNILEYSLCSELHYIWNYILEGNLQHFRRLSETKVYWRIGQ